MRCSERKGRGHTPCLCVRGGFPANGGEASVAEKPRSSPGIRSHKDLADVQVSSQLMAHVHASLFPPFRSFYKPREKTSSGEDSQNPPKLEMAA